MNKIGIIADTSQDLTFELGEKYDIEILSYHVQLGNRHYKDLIDIGTREFYQTMGNYDTLMTGIPSVTDLEEKLNKFRDEGTKDILIFVSSDKLTGLEALAGTVKSYYEGLNIHIYQTGQIGSSAGLFSIYAAELRERNYTLDQIVQELDRIKSKENVNIMALFRTLKYIVKGGRFNKYKGMVGMFLKINPVLRLIDGSIEVVDKVRGKQKSLKVLADTIKDDLKDAKKYKIVLFSGDNDEEIQDLKELLKAEIDNAEMYLETELTTVLGVHAGPKSIGVSYMILD